MACPWTPSANCRAWNTSEKASPVSVSLATSSIQSPRVRLDPKGAGKEGPERLARLLGGGEDDGEGGQQREPEGGEGLSGLAPAAAALEGRGAHARASRKLAGSCSSMPSMWRPSRSGVTPGPLRKAATTRPR